MLPRAAVPAGTLPARWPGMVSAARRRPRATKGLALTRPLTPPCMSRPLTWGVARRTILTQTGGPHRQGMEAPPLRDVIVTMMMMMMMTMIFIRMIAPTGTKRGQLSLSLSLLSRPPPTVSPLLAFPRLPFRSSPPALPLPPHLLPKPPLLPTRPNRSPPLPPTCSPLTPTFSPSPTPLLPPVAGDCSLHADCHDHSLFVSHGMHRCVGRAREIGRAKRAFGSRSRDREGALSAEARKEPLSVPLRCVRVLVQCSSSGSGTLCLGLNFRGFSRHFYRRLVSLHRRDLH